MFCIQGILSSRALGIALIYVVYHYSRARRASAVYKKIAVLYNIKKTHSDQMAVYKIPFSRARALGLAAAQPLGRVRARAKVSLILHTNQMDNVGKYHL